MAHQTNSIHHHRGKRDAVTVSAPGKALIAGGYLVLESTPGLVLATESCFHSTICVRPIHLDSRQNNSNNDDNDDKVLDYPLPLPPSFLENQSYCAIDVYSPQFHVIYSYWLIYDLLLIDTNFDAKKPHTISPFMTLQQRYSNQDSNSFVEKTLLISLSYTFYHISKTLNTNANDILASLLPSTKEEALAFKLRADNDFYSQIHTLDSLNLKYTPCNVSSLNAFQNCPIQDGKKEKKVVVNKTGLGSSAALVTCLVASILSHFDVIDIENINKNCDESMFHRKGEVGQKCKEDDITVGDTLNCNPKTTPQSCIESQNLNLAHNLSQISHSFAQGKIGSGFDVSAAIHGSHIYQRFSKSVIEPIMESLSLDIENEDEKRDNSLVRLSVSLATVKDLYHCVNNEKNWDGKVQAFYLPNGMELIMADVCGGSASPSMARSVLKWRKNCLEKEEDNTNENKCPEWDALKDANVKLEKIFQLSNLQMAKGIPHQISKHKLSSLSLFSKSKQNNELVDDILKSGFMEAEYDDLTERTDAISQYVHHSVLPFLQEVRETFQTARRHLKKMGEKVGVPIEPDSQTNLANATMELPGVVAAGVPGAGGYDALFALYIVGGDSADLKIVRNRIGEFWQEWSQKEGSLVCPLACKSVKFGGMSGLHKSKLKWL